MNVLITGGAGYIGSHATRRLIEAGHQAIVLDDLSSGQRWAVPGDAKFYEGSTGDESLLNTIFSSESIDAVFHFAANVEVNESIQNPLQYYENNITNGVKLLKACMEHQVHKFVFSSSAAVYGDVDTIEPVNESEPTNPISPYGRTKLMMENILADVSTGHPDFHYVALRYFNVAGAHSSGEIGQATPNASHLIKVACEVATGQREKMSIFGNDYDTKDGTCVRDFIHVEDLVEAHLDALAYLDRENTSNVFNCGYGEGFTVLETVNTIRELSGSEFEIEFTERRTGDLVDLKADNQKIIKTLGWKPKHNDIQLICRSALDWERKLLTRDR